MYMITIYSGYYSQAKNTQNGFQFPSLSGSTSSKKTENQVFITLKGILIQCNVHDHYIQWTLFTDQKHAVLFSVSISFEKSHFFKMQNVASSQH